MKRFAIAIVFAVSLALAGCADSNAASQGVSTSSVSSTAASSTSASAYGESESSDSSASTPEESGDREEHSMLSIQVGDTTLHATLADNSSADALVELLGEGPLTLSLHDYGNFEKVGPLPQSLPTNDEQITTEPGDVILYQGNQITIYYDVNSWNFTRLAKIEGATTESLLEVLGDGDVEVTLSLG